MGLPPEEPPAGAPEWVVTYGDMMSLLLTFFILLAAFSEIKSPETKERIIESIVEQFGDVTALRDFLASKTLNRTDKPVGDKVESENVPTTDRMMGAAGSLGTPGRSSAVETIRDGKRQIVGGAPLFAPGSATLLPEAKSSIHAIAEGLRGKWHLIDVQGFVPTGNHPFASAFADPVELAFSRAAAVADYLADHEGIPRSILRISVAAPRESDMMAESQAEKDSLERVVITTLESSRGNYENPPAPQ